MLHMIGNAHLDPIWLWTKLEGYAEIISTFESAVRRLEENKQFIFTCSSAAYYEFVKEQNPALFEKIRYYVKEERWFISGGWWVEPDDNLADGEVYARHALYSQRFYQENFGVKCKIGYCVDSFGHAASLPKLLNGSGMDKFIFMRPMDNENGALPVLFNWSAEDGSSVVTYKITGQNYNSIGLDWLRRDLKNLKADEEKLGHQLICMFGVGNHGGGPTRAQLKEINGQIEMGEKLKYSSPAIYFNEILKSGVNLQQVTGDLQYHAIGCYSVASNVKAALREAEHQLKTAEKLSVMASTLCASPLSTVEVCSAYKDLLFNTFHDVLCGCCIKEGLDTAVKYLYGCVAVADRIKQRAIIDIAKNINTMIDGVTLNGKEDWQLWEDSNLGVPIVVFNTNSFILNTQICVSREFKSCIDSNGKALKIQYCQDKFINGCDTRATVFEAVVPPLGYITYWLYKDKIIQPSEKENIDKKGTYVNTNKNGCFLNSTEDYSFHKGEDYFLENSFLRIEFDNHGGIKRLYDKQNNKEFLSDSSFVPYVIDDNSDTWSHAIASFEEKNVKFMQLDKIKVTNFGELFAAVEVTCKIGSSYMISTYRLNRAESHLRVHVKLNYQEKNTILRLAAITDESFKTIIHQVPYGYIDKIADGRENAAVKWAAISNNSQSLAIVTDCKSSFCASGGSLKFIAARNTVYANHFSKLEENYRYDYTDEGLSEFNYIICPMAEIKPQKLYELAETIKGTEYLVDTYHYGNLARAASLILISNPLIELSSLKGAEDGDGYVLRLFDSGGIGADTDIEFLDKSFSLTFKPGEIKTVRIKKEELLETDFTE